MFCFRMKIGLFDELDFLLFLYVFSLVLLVGCCCFGRGGC